MYTYVIIDDEELIRKGTIKKLQPLADEIICIGEAENGSQGIDLVKEKKPDFVIMDMQMPIMNGMDLLPWFCENYPEIPLIVISGYRDFDYIKQAISSNAIDYILKPFSKNEIQESVHQAISKLESRSHFETRMLDTQREKEKAYYDYDIQMISNLILGNHVSSTSFSSEKLKSLQDSHLYFLMTLHFSGYIDPSLIKSHLEEYAYSDLILYIPGTQSSNLGYFLVYIPENSPFSKETFAHEILVLFHSWFSDQHIEIIAGISNVRKEISDLGNAFVETSNALNHQSVSNSSSDCYFFTQEYDPRILEWMQLEEFLLYIDAGAPDKVTAIVNDLFLWYQTKTDCTLADIKLHCHLLAEQCRAILNNYLQNQTVKEKSVSVQNIVNHLFTLDELKDYYLQFFTNLATMIQPLSVYAVDDIIEKIQIYMNRNYQKNLTQDLVASLFYLNRSYLSTLFKSKTGINFTDYLNSIRIEHAKELLLHSNKKMYSVAKAVGYDNVKYFFRVFKKHTGETPEQYRKQ